MTQDQLQKSDYLSLSGIFAMLSVTIYLLQTTIMSK